MSVNKCLYPHCDEDVYRGSDCCILHLKVPDKSDSKFTEINRQKSLKIQEKLSKSDYDFTGAKFYSVDLSGIEINDNFFFNDVFVKKDAIFKGVQIKGHANFNKLVIENGKLDFSHSKIEKRLNLCNANIIGPIVLEQVKISGTFDFSCNSIRGRVNSIFVTGSASTHHNTEYIRGGVYIQNVDINGDLSFLYMFLGHIHLQNVNIARSLYLTESTVEGDIHIERVSIDADCWFNKSVIKKGFFHEILDIKGKIDMQDTIFTLPQAEEEASRLGKIFSEKMGDEENAKKYRQREQKAKLKQKNWLVQCFDFFLKTIPGIIITFLVTIIIFGIVYVKIGVLDSSSFFDNLYFSFFNAILPGFIFYKPVTHYPEVAYVEAVIGAFLWAFLIAFLVKKYD
jgi:hypothetical protein